MEVERILKIDDKEDLKVLRKKTAMFDFSKHSKKEIREVLDKMRVIMKGADGMGLSANQVGLDMRFFICEVEGKFYAVFNPEISKLSKDTWGIEEGCLSIPDEFGHVTRPDRLVLRGFDKNGKKLKIKAWGLLAIVFQHEVDHLDGKLFIDHIK